MGGNMNDVREGMNTQRMPAPKNEAEAQQRAHLAQVNRTKLANLVCRLSGADPTDPDSDAFREAAACFRDVAPALGFDAPWLTS